MDRKLAPDALDVLIRREGEYIVLEFLDAKCYCWSERKECYSTGYIRLTPWEAIRIAWRLLKVAVKV